MAHARLEAFAPNANQTASAQQCSRLAARYRTEAGGRRDPATGRELLIELREFGDPMFDVDRYLQRHMGASSRDTRTFITHLLVLKDVAKEQLQRREYLSLPTILKAAELVTAAEGDLQAIERSLVALQKVIGAVGAVSFPPRQAESDPMVESAIAAPQIGFGLLTLRDSRGSNAEFAAATAALSPSDRAALGAIEVAVFEGRLGPAVDTFLRLRTDHSAVNPEVDPLAPMAEALYDAIVERLAGPESLHSFDTYLELLLRLDHLEDAADLFLRQRTTLLRDAVEKVAFSGDFLLYAKRCASLFFLFLRLASNQYRKLFGSLRLSALVRWIVLETDRFAQVLRRRLFQSGVYRHAVRSCRKAFGYCQRLEISIGVPLLARFQAAFLDDLHALVARHFDEVTQAVHRSVTTDAFEPREMEAPSPLFVQRPDHPPGDQEPPELELSDCCRELLATVQSEVTSHLLVLQHPTLHWYEAGFQLVLERFLTDLRAHVDTAGCTDAQYLVAVADAQFVTDRLLPDLVAALMARFKQTSLHRLHLLHDKLQPVRSQLLEAYIATKRQAFRHTLVPNSGTEGRPTGTDQDVQVSRTMIALASHLVALLPELRRFLGDEEGDETAGRLACALAADFAQEAYWVETYKRHYLQRAPKAAPPESLALADAYQVFLDVELFRVVFADQLGTTEAVGVKRLQGDVLLRHFRQAGLAEKKEAEFRGLAGEVVARSLKAHPELGAAPPS